MKVAADGKCWAEPVGGCDGPITREHLATDSLFDGKARALGGMSRNAGVESSFRLLTANILCRAHNNELGRTADAAAQKLHRHLQTSHTPMKLHGSRILRAPVERRVSGVNFGRWLCKTHCNYTVAHGLEPDRAFVEYAFQRRLSKPIYIYFAGQKDETTNLANGRNPIVHWGQLVDVDENVIGFELSLAGFASVVSANPLRLGNQQLVDRICTLQWHTPLGPYRISFDWQGEAQPVQCVEHNA